MKITGFKDFNSVTYGRLKFGSFFKYKNVIYLKVGYANEQSNALMCEVSAYDHIFSVDENVIHYPNATVDLGEN